MPATQPPKAAGRAAPAGRPGWFRYPNVVAGLLVVFAVTLGGHAMWRGLLAMPRSYATLAADGVPVTLTITGCAPGNGGGRGLACTVTTSYRGHARTWTYPYDVDQFAPYATGQTVPALLDPTHPTTVFTVHDVRSRAGAGPLSSTTLFGAGCLTGAAVLASWLCRWRRRTQRRLLQLRGH